MEKCCGMKFGPIILSKVGRIIIIFLYALAIAIASFGVSRLEVFFDQMLFVSKESELYDWFVANENYFTTGTWAPTEIYV